MPHLQPGDKAVLLPTDVSQRPMSMALFKSRDLEVVHFVMQPGQELRSHRAPGEITVQCLQGRIAVQHGEQPAVTELGAAEMLFLAGGEPHAVQALETSMFLVTIALKN